MQWVPLIDFIFFFCFLLLFELLFFHFPWPSRSKRTCAGCRVAPCSWGRCSSVGSWQRRKCSPAERQKVRLIRYIVAGIHIAKLERVLWGLHLHDWLYGDGRRGPTPEGDVPRSHAQQPPCTPVVAISNLRAICCHLRRQRGAEAEEERERER